MRRDTRILALLALGTASALDGCTLLEGFDQFRAGDAGRDDGSIDAAAPDAGDAQARDADLRDADLRDAMLDAFAPDARDVGTAPDAGPVTLSITFTPGAAASLGTGVVLTSPGGIACGTPGGAGCSLSAPRGTTVILTIAPWASVSDWGDTGCVPGSTCTVRLDADTHLVVRADALGNLAFVTHDTFTVTSLAIRTPDDGSATCTSAASAAGLPGSFIALMAVPPVRPASAHPTPNAGFLRLDGRPVSLVGHGIDPSTGQLVHPLDIDENGDVVPIDAASIAYLAPTRSCPGAGMLNLGSVHNVLGFGPLSSPIECDTSGFGARLFCLQSPTRTFVAVSPPTVDMAAAYVFVSTPMSAVGRARGLLDASCTLDATLAGLPGTYRALVGSPTASPLSMITGPDRVVRRADHYQLAAHVADFFTTNPLATAPSLRADRTAFSGYLATGLPLSAPADVASVLETCDDWMNEAGSAASAIPTSAAWPPLPLLQDAHARNIGSYTHVLVLPCTMMLPTYCIRVD